MEFKTVQDVDLQVTSDSDLVITFLCTSAMIFGLVVGNN